MFKRKMNGRVSAAFDDEEAGLLRKVIVEYQQMLDADRPASDPLLQRLFPNASFDDEKLNADYASLTRGELETLKREAAARALASLGGSGPWAGPVGDVDRESWLTLLTDLRLAIGVQLAVNEETMQMVPDPRDPNQWPLAVLHYLGAVQESLIRALS